MTLLNNEIYCACSCVGLLHLSLVAELRDSEESSEISGRKCVVVLRVQSDNIVED